MGDAWVMPLLLGWMGFICVFLSYVGPSWTHKPTLHVSCICHVPSHRSCRSPRWAACAAAGPSHTVHTSCPARPCHAWRGPLRPL